MTSHPQFLLPEVGVSEVPHTPCYVGTIAEWNPETETSSHSFPMNSSQEVYVGRNLSSRDYNLEDRYVSRRQLRIYTIIFDRDNPQELAPLVYAQDLSRNGTLWNGYFMGKGNGSYLLSDGDILHLRPGTSLRYTCRDNRNQDRLDTLQSMESRAFGDKYVITQRILGSGAYGKVRMAFRKDTGQQLACKIIDLRVLKERFIRELEEEPRSRFFDSTKRSKVVAVRRLRTLEEKLAVYDREAEILEGLSHPNIIGVERVIKSSNTIYLFQDLITAGDLFSFIQYKGGRLPDIEVAVIVRQISMALDYLHDRDIVHRDLKPDNILMTSLADGCRVVLTDFGCARFVRPRLERMSTIVGTLDYSAPEVLHETDQGYTKAVDLWSLGCVTFVLLTGDIPFKDDFTGTSRLEVAQTTGLGQLEADFQRNHTGERAADFVRRLLVLNEMERMDVKQALGHDWFSNPAHKAEFDALYLRSIKNWKPRERNGELTIHLSDLINESESSAEAQGSQSQLSDDTRRGWSPQRNHTFDSTTLSDPDLPPLRRMKDPLTFVREGISSQSQTNSPIDPNSSSRISTSPHQDTQSSHADDRQDAKVIRRRVTSDYQYYDVAKAQVLNNKGLEDQPSPIHGDDDDGEVYEEVSNCITGKKPRLVYGANEYREDKK
ncbi:Pkinase-domain-containing protein [Aspergillus steynii IBT 23096]|uniref:Pkinase-domain-containing protein n=1 Tax=Aspergillus steynii IBT 23096 TaxID=1392250 RepID=A0A2I2GLB2_9EURO|nr:Pkinase-domain-containing protein [Aspergillus steynii IBT 23096]PLB53663.1 Pkinase-domain-containing protein [Aspergillus steynii IBT 23096]